MARSALQSQLQAVDTEGVSTPALATSAAKQPAVGTGRPGLFRPTSRREARLLSGLACLVVGVLGLLTLNAVSTLDLRLQQGREAQAAHHLSALPVAAGFTLAPPSQTAHEQCSGQPQVCWLSSLEVPTAYAQIAQILAQHGYSDDLQGSGMNADLREQVATVARTVIPVLPAKPEQYVPACSWIGQRADCLNVFGSGNVRLFVTVSPQRTTVHTRTGKRLVAQGSVATISVLENPAPLSVGALSHLLELS